jgi:hypothetical protein
LIATPSGEVPIEDLRVGDLIYSLEADQIRIVALVKVARTAVYRHQVMRVRMSDGSVLEISGPHPTADGRRLSDLAVGDIVDGRTVVESELVPYSHAFTYDILPDSSTGSYVAEGLWMGTTLVQIGSSTGNASALHRH